MDSLTSSEHMVKSPEIEFNHFLISSVRSVL